MLITTEMAVGSHAWFFRRGDAFILPEPGGNASDAALPDADDLGWIELGTIDDWEDTIEDEEEKAVWTPVPGHLVKKRVITTKQGLGIKLTSSQLTPLAIELFYRTAEKLDQDSFQFDPLSGVPRDGWLKIQRYSEQDALVLAADLYVQLKVTGGMKGGGGNLIAPEFKATLLYSGLSTMAMGTPPAE
ncbi:MAG TPA: hypothetical protein VG167_00910 [Verrucomicrobiae bacterium]|nr:hypothetical protein [Verrucomicrobiae bacterium]